jgi:hypothetical protein
MLSGCCVFLNKNDIIFYNSNVLIDKCCSSRRDEACILTDEVHTEKQNETMLCMRDERVFQVLGKDCSRKSKKRNISIGSLYAL